MRIKPITPVAAIFREKHWMPRNLNTVKRDKFVDVFCVDTDKTVEAKVIFQDVSKIVVELPRGVRLTLDKHARQPKTYVGQQGGMTFECKCD